MAKDKEEWVPKAGSAELLVEHGVIDSSQLARILAERNSLPYVDLKRPSRWIREPPTWSTPSRHADTKRFRSPSLDGGGLLVATSDPTKTCSAPTNIGNVDWATT